MYRISKIDEPLLTFQVMKLSLGYMLLNCPRLIKPTIFTLRKLGIDYKEKVIGLLRGFPKEMMKRIRQRPCSALLGTMKMRMADFSQENYLMSNVKAEYALAKLPSGATMVGMNAQTRNHWLFPVLVVGLLMKWSFSRSSRY